MDKKIKEAKENGGTARRGKVTTKRGAASFYIVALSTLILVIVATSFATVIISEIARTSNDDLSQSAYDSALAGVEDAKVAFSNYRRCVEAGATAVDPSVGGSSNCGAIVWWMENPNCTMVGHILGKLTGSESEVTIGGVAVTGASGTTTTNQAYTCVMINTNLSDYRATLSADTSAHVIRAGVRDGGSNTVTKVRISWYAVREDNKEFLKFSNFDEAVAPIGRVAFTQSSSGNTAVPPTLEVQIVQTAESFTMADFDRVDSGKTNRGTVYLVPTKNATLAGTSGDDRIGAWNDVDHVNYIDRNMVAKTNDHSVSNKPFAVYCNPDTGDEFYCSADIQLPDAIGTTGRANDTFMIGVSLPYQRPDTDFSIELICEDASGCGGDVVAAASGPVVKIKNTQVSIDSTGRANDLYRRVETRLETSDTAFGFGSPYYALQILGGGATEKTMSVTCELGSGSGCGSGSGFYF